MYCNKCGKEIKSGNFCTYCGNSIKQEDSEPEKSNVGTEVKIEGTPKNAKGNKKLWAFSACVVVGVAVLLVCFFYKSNNTKFVEYVDSHNYSEAAVLLKEMQETPEDEKEAKEFLDGKISGLLEEYYATTITYEDFKTELDNYEEMYPEAVKVALDKAEVLYESQNAFAEAEELFAMGEYKKAQSVYLKVIKEDKNYDTAQEKYNECYSELKNLLQEAARELADNGKTAEAIVKIDAELAFFREEDNSELMQVRQDIIDGYFSNVLLQVEEMLGAGNYAEAIDVLADAELEMSMLNDLTLLKEKRDEVCNKYLDNELLKVNDYILAQEFEEALAMLPSIQKVVGANTKLTEKEAEIIQLYENHMTDRFYAELDKRDFTAATQVLAEAKGALPQSSAFAGLSDELAEYNPVSIYTMEPYLVGDKQLYVNSSVEDTMGNIYEKAYRVASKSDDGELYGVYDISNKYSVLTGVVAVANESKGGEGAGHIRIYGDGVLLWSDTNITSAVKPYEMSVNISGVTDLKIEIGRGGKESYNGVHVLFANVTLQK